MTHPNGPHPGPDARGLPTRLLRQVLRQASAPRQRRAYPAHLNDHLLRDIGLSRSQLADLDRIPEAASPHHPEGR